MSRRPLPQARPRRGFTIIELLVAMTMITVLGAAVVSVLNNQQRFVRAASDVGGLRTQLQTAAAVLPAELRNISAVGNDIIGMSDSSIHVRTTIATSVVCNFTAGGTVTLAPSGAISTTDGDGNATTVRFTSQLLTPEPGDSAFIWDEGPTGMGSDDTWVSASGRAYAIDNVSSSSGVCTPPYAPATNALQATVLTISGDTPLRGTLARGSAVRVTRQARYGLYTSPLDGQWYLGYADPGFTEYQYVAGPLLEYSANGKTGLRFRYFDSSGNEIVDYTQRNAVARIEITASARTATASSLAGTAQGKVHQDSLRVGLSIRNR